MTAAQHRRHLAEKNTVRGQSVYIYEWLQGGALDAL